MDFDSRLRGVTYAVARARGIPPTIAELAAAVSADPGHVRAALERLHAARVLVLQPASGEILMAPPFSAVPTPFVVESSRHSAYANCTWDALGVPVMLQEPSRMITGCACCGEAIALAVAADRPPESTEVVHFAVPAARWWHDIVFT